MVKTYYININNISFEEIKIPLPSYFSDKISRLIHDSDKKRELAAALLVVGVFGCREIKTGEFGKPFIEGERQFNLSHSGDFVILSVGDSEVGCDIEQIHEVDYERLGKIVYCENELSLLSESENKAECFFTLWTRKESFIKCLGDGFHFPAKSIDLSSAEKSVEHKGQSYFFKEYMLAGYKIMICSRENSFADLEEWYEKI